MQLTHRSNHFRSLRLAAPLAPVDLVKGVTSRNRQLISTLAVTLLATLAPALASAPAAAQSCETIASLKLPDTTITSAAQVAEGPFTPPGAPPPGGPLQASQRPVKLAAFCRVGITVAPAIKL